MSSRTSLIRWARRFAQILVDEGPQTSYRRRYEECFALSLLDVTDSKLLEALEAVKDRSERGGSFAWVEIYEHPDVFDSVFTSVVAYGMLYAELHLTLDRYANYPVELWRSDYYSEDMFDEGVGIRYRFNPNKHASWSAVREGHTIA